MLMFTKLSLISFIYDVVKAFCFPNQIVRKTSTKNIKSKKVFQHLLTDTDSTCLMLLFICEIGVSTPDHIVRNIIFEVITKTDIKERYDTYDPFWEKFQRES